MAWVNSKSGWPVFLGTLSPGPEDRILDVGAGRGTIAGKVLGASKGAEVYAVDPNEERVAIMKQRVPGVKSSVAGAESLPFPDSYFDKAYTTMALHHFADVDTSIREIARVLKQGGVLVVLEVDPHSALARLYGFFAKLTGERLGFFSEEQLVSKLEASGSFKLVRSVRQSYSYLVQLARV